MISKIFRWFSGLFVALALSITGFTPALAAPPANDNFADAESISSLPFSATVDNSEATAEPDEPVGCGDVFQSVWYSFTPTENMVIEMDMFGSTVGANVIKTYLASGPSISDLTFLTCTGSGGSTHLQLEAGQTYFLQVDSAGQGGLLQINVEQILPPANDGFANAEAISSLPFSATVDNTNASLESGEPQGCSFPFRSVWYSFTPTENMTFQINMDGSAVRGIVNLFLASGPGIADLTSLACAFSGNSSNFQLEGGKTYYLRVDSFSQPGALRINLEQGFPPTNDNFVNAEAINSLPFSATVDNTDATNEPNEPVGCGFPIRGVWYSFTAAGNMAIRVNLAQNTSLGNVSIFLATGPAITDLTSLTCVSNSGSSNMLVEAGKTYYLRVDSFGQPGILQISVEQIFPPSNDNFANAEAISSLPFSATVDNTNATTEPGEVANCSIPSRTVWYTFTPAENMAVRVGLTGGTVNGIVNTYLASGSSMSDLTFLTCSLSSSTNLQVEAGKTYYLQVDSSGQAGVLNVEQITPPANDNFADAETIPSLPFSVTVDNTNATIELGEGSDCGSQFRSVWYSFSPTVNTEVRMNTAGSIAPGNVSIYLASGSSVSDLTFLTCTTGGSSAKLQIEAGKTYYLRVDSYGQAGAIQVNLEQTAPPANDSFASAGVISSLPFSDSVNITDATSEPNEPQPCYFMERTVWYSFTPTESMMVQADVQGSGISANVNIYVAAGTGFSDLQFLTCTTAGGSSAFNVEANHTYYLQAGSAFGEVGNLQINLQQIPPPANDDFANASTITSVPFDHIVDTSAASLETSEPTPSCAPNGLFNTVWYAFTPNTSGSISVSNASNSFSPVVAAYTGSSLASLTEVRCQTDGFVMTFMVQAGTTYYFQAGGLFDSGHGGPMQFHVEVTPAPVAGFSFNPSEPSVFDAIGFCDYSSDPGEAGFQSFGWDFGDQTTISTTDSCLFHQYAVDGDYTVQHSVTTVDGRTASTSQIIHVRTHDVSITKIAAPKSGKSGRIVTITVSVRNRNYPETVRIDLYKSTSGDDVQIGSLILQVPVLRGSKTTQFKFNYTFTEEDAQIGKVTFRAVATMEGANDAFPQDNTAISSPPTIVKR